jgi:hypothetical protein
MFFSKNISGDFIGLNFQNTSFRNTTKHIYTSVYPRAKSLAGYFMRNPFTEMPTGKPYKEACGEICLIYLHDTQSPSKDEVGALR